MIYFGTNLTSAGHHFWKCEGDRLVFTNLRIRDFPFDAEANAPTGRNQLGQVHFFHSGKYSVLRIEGSCRDHRPGSKSVFIIGEHVLELQMTTEIMNIPITKKIIESVPFEVKWNIK